MAPPAVPPTLPPREGREEHDAGVAARATPPSHVGPTAAHVAGGFGASGAGFASGFGAGFAGAGGFGGADSSHHTV